MDIDKTRHCKVGHTEEGNQMHYLMEGGRLQVKPLRAFATIPIRATKQSAGVDLSSAQNAVIPPGGRLLVSTDLIIKCPHGTYGRISSRRYGLGIILECMISLHYFDILLCNIQYIYLSSINHT